ncbi:acetoin utilization protein AcuA [Desulfotomaculum arcticum]|uniref:Acetoin utilization protein AcuA n=1 Tax=Desulfotruncus arcticus DSM 17038 TaxID=1121424 RepID=A0A1I2XH60_9FIRM|nr:GNAT family N-acetyltransferase [Desulfotruncus arcticus]SFH11391.1 acetoin utilization protein AcuA [Desulfotomaculum arcticum] [Desulfotruncus arcticus DSM 17038]
MTTQLTTSKGPVVIEGPVSTDYVESLGIIKSLNNFRNAKRQKEALGHIAGLPDGMVYIARHDNEIIGYVLFHYPNQYSRWVKHPRILELGAIEISREWQRRGLAKAILAEAFKNPVLEDYIIITTEFYWHWDIRNSGLDVWGYQRMLKNVFGSVGFKRRRTDDPEILEHQANMLMVRVGNNVSPNHTKMFDNLTYQQSIIF